jgi:cellulose synthase/poly-beta-1,6-N-acetylglucosamine synthase-like glycosyltransferase
LNLLHVLAIILLSAVYVWIFYQIPILAVGVGQLRRSSRKTEKTSAISVMNLPMVSIIVPVKDEERVVGRLLKALLRLDYSLEKMEILIVEDGSTDKTVEICKEYARLYPDQVRLLHKHESNGKPSALNFAFKYAKGDVIAVFDADNVPEPDVLMRAVAYFRDPSVAAVQGRLCIINAGENMLTKFISCEEAAWCEAYLRGKDVLNLFVHLKGSCQFIRRDFLERIGGFDGEALSEDMDLSVRLAEKGYKIRYASDVCSWQEAPSQVEQLFRQRTRWFRGTMEVALKCGRLMAKPNIRNFDAELTLLGPFILIASLTSYLLALYASFAAFHFDFMLQLLMQLSALGTSIMLIICGLALAYASKPRRPANILWLPFIYFYWSLQAFIALCAGLLLVFRKPSVWVKTEKKGTVAILHFTQMPLDKAFSRQKRTHA